MVQFSEGIATVGAARVRWRRRGQGPVLVFLPGFPLPGDTWDGVIAALADRFSCITFDPIGSAGLRAPTPASIPRRDRRAFQPALAQLGVSSTALVGNDTGGWIAREAVGEGEIKPSGSGVTQVASAEFPHPVPRPTNRNLVRRA